MILNSCFLQFVLTCCFSQFEWCKLKSSTTTCFFLNFSCNVYLRLNNALTFSLSLHELYMLWMLMILSFVVRILNEIRFLLWNMWMYTVFVILLLTNRHTLVIAFDMYRNSKCCESLLFVVSWNEFFHDFWMIKMLYFSMFFVSNNDIMTFVLELLTLYCNIDNVLFFNILQMS